jgi:cobaltochelatase CobN
LQALIDDGGWQDRADLAESYLAWGGYAYGREPPARPSTPSLRARLAGVEAVVHNQDNREHDSSTATTTTSSRAA